MSGVAYQFATELQQNVEIVVHVDENLSDSQRNDLVNHLVSSDGIASAEFCPLRYHLMLVRYDRGLYNSQDVLKQVNSRNIHAELIGPV